MMFRMQDFIDRNNERPFTPFRIHTSSGRTHDVPNPELAIATRNFIYIGVPLKDHRPGGAEELIKIALLQITELEPCGGPNPPSTSNGVSVPS